MTVLTDDPSGHEFESVFGCDPAKMREKLWPVAIRLTKHPSEADELVQEVMEFFIERGVHPDVKDPVAYVRKALAHRFYSNKRKPEHDVPSPMDEESRTVASGDPPTDMLGSAALVRNDIIAALAQLTPAVQDVAMLLIDWQSGDFRHISQAEAAATLGIKPDTVRDRLREARVQLRKLLSPYKGELG